MEGIQTPACTRWRQSNQASHDTLHRTADSRQEEEELFCGLEEYEGGAGRRRAKSNHFPTSNAVSCMT